MCVIVQVARAMRVARTRLFHPRILGVNMPVSNIFGATVAARALPSVVFLTAPTAVASGSTLTAAQLLGGINVDGTGGGNVQLPTAVSVGALLYGAVAVGDTFEFVNQGNNSSITTNTGWTITGLPNTAASGGASARFLARVTAVPTAADGTGTTLTLYRA